MEAFAAWAMVMRVRPIAFARPGGSAEAARRELLDALRAAFVTPLEPEDAFTLSRGVDRIVGHALDLVGEAEVMASPPDSGVGQMADLLAQAVRQIDEAIAHLGSDSDAATDRRGRRSGHRTSGREGLLPGDGRSPRGRRHEGADLPARALSPVRADW